MKIIITVLAGNFVTILSGCFDMSNALSGSTGYLEEDGGSVPDCKGRKINISSSPSGAERFWKNNNLPKGTTKFVCKDGKAYLPNKVTDCQGNLIAKQPGGIDQFKLNNNFPKYENGEMVWYTAFKCEGSKVVPIDHTKE